MPTFAVLPDLDAALIAFLDTHADLIPLHGGRVGTKLATGSLTSIRIANLGGTMPDPRVYRAEFQVECWGGTDIQANQLARTVCAVIFEMPATLDYVVTAVPTLAPLSSPDSVSNRPRYITQVQIEATP
jgi:hypothetical protein